MSLISKDKTESPLSSFPLLLSPSTLFPLLPLTSPNNGHTCNPTNSHIPNSALQRCSAAQSELFDAQSTMSDTLSEFYDVPSALQPVCGLNKESKNYMLTQVMK